MKIDIYLVLSITETYRTKLIPLNGHWQNKTLHQAALQSSVLWYAGETETSLSCVARGAQWINQSSGANTLTTIQSLLACIISTTGCNVVCCNAVKYCSTVSVPMTTDSWWSSSWPAADTRWSAATSAGCSPLRRVILLPVSTCRYFYVCRYFSVCWVTMSVWPVWRTLISPLILLLIICPSLKGSKSSVGRTVGSLHRQIVT